MNVRIVCPQFTPVGGTQLAIWQLARHLRARNHGVRVLTFVADEMAGVDIKRISDPMFSGFSRILVMRRAAKRDVHRDERRYATGPDDPTAHVVTFHACAEWRLQEIGNRRVRFGGHSIRDWLRPLYHRAYLKATAQLERRIVRRAASGATTLTAVSATLAAQIRAAYGADVPIEITPNGVDRDVFSPATVSRLRSSAREQYGVSSEDFVVGFVGGDWHRKNVGTFIRAIGLARRRSPRINGLVLGHGDVRAFSEDLRENPVRFAGVSRNPIEFYSAIDAFYSPSPVESFGLPPLEAMACGIPAVVCAGIGLLDFMNPDEVNVLADPFDAQAAADVLVELCEDAALRARFSAAGVRAAERLPWSRSANAIETMLMAAPRMPECAFFT